MLNQFMKARSHSNATFVTAAFLKRVPSRDMLNQFIKGNKPFKCNICDYSCSTKSDLNRHVASVHEGKKPFKCDICDYSSSRKGDLIKHVASTHEGKKVVL